MGMHRRLWASLGLLAVLGACSDSDDTAAGSSASVQPSLGQVYNAAVSATCLGSGTVLGTGNTGTSGNVNLTLTGDCSGPVLVKLTAGGGSSYFDEALGSVVGLPAGTQLRAVLPSYSSGALSMALTPLTEIATQRALALAGGNAQAMTTAQATEANQAVVTQVLGAGVSLDILKPPTAWNAETHSQPGTLGTSEADRYAYHLASLARMGGTSGTPALNVLQALAADLADGTLSGTATGSFTYTPASLGEQLQSARVAMSSHASAQLKGQLGLNPPVVVGGFSPSSGKVGDTVTVTGTGFDPDRFHMRVLFKPSVAAEIVSSSATTLVVKVPDGAEDGPITVENTLTSKSQTSTQSFTVTSSGGGGGGTGNWVQRASPSAFVQKGLAYGAGKFVSVGMGSSIATSSDGISWTARTAPAGYWEARSVIYTGTEFVMVGDAAYATPSKPPMIATSADGITWTAHTWTHGSETLLVDATFANGRITLVGLAGTILSTTNLSGSRTWSNESTGHALLTSMYYSGVADSGTVRVAVGRNADYEGKIVVNSGSGWVTATTAISSFCPSDVVWAGTRFVAVGGATCGLSNAVAMTSTDGMNWTRVDIATSIAPANHALAKVYWDGSKLYATGDNLQNGRVIISSTDGSSWVQEHVSTGSGNATLLGIASSPTRLVTVGGVNSITKP